MNSKLQGRGPKWLGFLIAVPCALRHRRPLSLFLVMGHQSGEMGGVNRGHRLAAFYRVCRETRGRVAGGGGQGQTTPAPPPRAPHRACRAAHRRDYTRSPLPPAPLPRVPAPAPAPGSSPPTPGAKLQRILKSDKRAPGDRPGSFQGIENPWRDREPKTLLTLSRYQGLFTWPKKTGHPRARRGSAAPPSLRLWAGPFLHSVLTIADRPQPPQRWREHTMGLHSFHTLPTRAALASAA